MQETSALLPLVLLAGSLSLACERESPSKEAPAPVDAGTTAEMEDSEQSPTPSAESTNGLKCVKSALNIETTVHMGLVTRGGKLVTAIRTDKNSPGLSKAQAAALPSTFVFDDGKKAESFIWYGPDSKAGMKASFVESAYPPDDSKSTVQMAGHVHGKCNSWKVNPEFLLLPKGATFDTDLEDAMKGVTGAKKN